MWKEIKLRYGSICGHYVELLKQHYDYCCGVKFIPT